MLDSGSEVNLIKHDTLSPNIDIISSQVISVRGIANTPVLTHGTAVIELFGVAVVFHVVPNDFPISQDGIIGCGFMQEHRATIDYHREIFTLGKYELPFTSQLLIHMPARSTITMCAKIINPELQEGYVPRLPCPKGIYAGEAIVKNINGTALFKAINTTEDEVNMLVPTLRLHEYTTTTNHGFNSDNSDICNKRASELQGQAHQSVNISVAHHDLSESMNGTETNVRNSVLSKHEEAVDHRKNKSVSDSLGNPRICNLSEISVNSPRRASRIRELLNLQHLNEEELINANKLLTLSADCFHLPGEALDCTDVLKHRITTADNAPTHTKQYRFPLIHREEINKQTAELLKAKIIQPSLSPYNSPLWIVPKKTDAQGNPKWRMVIDYRNLNEKTIGDAYPLPNITEILDQLGSAKYFSVFDLASGFHQIPMDPEDKEKTAFTTPYGHYEFNRMPFGLKNAPATFQRLMDHVLSGLQGIELFVYLDDIVIYASSLKEHEIKYKKLIERLRQANLKLQPEKCEFLRREVAYLGHIIGEGVKPDPRKIKAVKSFPKPRNIKEIRQFLGFVGYYRRFIPQFSKLAKPLSDLLKKETPFKWNDSQEKAFDTLRDLLCEEPILQYPDFTRTFNVTTDASSYAVGAVLSQGEIGKDLPIAYCSRLLNNAERNYSTVERELLAIVYAVHYFRPYLYGREFILVTDHKPLVWLHSVKDPTSRLVKWRLKLAEYCYKIVYKAGTANANADALSRNPPTATALPVQTRQSTRIPYGETSGAQNISSEDEEASFEDCEEHVSEDESVPEDTSEDSLEEHYQPTTLSERPNRTSRDTTWNVVEINDGLTMRKDNLCIFVTQQGTPCCEGSKLLQAANKFPKFADLSLARARITNHGTKVLICLPIKERDNTRLDETILNDALESLLDVARELGLSTISIAQTIEIDDIPWAYIQQRLSDLFDHTTCRIIICKNTLRTPPLEEREALILENHASAIGGHKGVSKTYNRLRQRYYWKNMKEQVQTFIQGCQNCQLKKLIRVKHKQPMTLTDTPGTSFDKVALDIMGPLPTSTVGNRYILTMQDLLTKYLILIPLANTTSCDIADAMRKGLLSYFGAPRCILTDQGKNFTSSLIRILAKKYKIKQIRTTAFHPQSNGSLERSHHVITEYLKQIVEDKDEWDDYLDMAMFCYNTSTHEGTRFTPCELVLGKPARTPSADPPLEDDLSPTYLDYYIKLITRINRVTELARQNLDNAKLKSKAYYDRHINPQELLIGEFVYLLKEPNSKFGDQYTGPHEVLEILSSNNIRILVGTRTKVVHLNKVRKARTEFSSVTDDP